MLATRRYKGWPCVGTDDYCNYNGPAVYDADTADFGDRQCSVHRASDQRAVDDAADRAPAIGGRDDATGAGHHYRTTECHG